jgi:dolichol kinase
MLGILGYSFMEYFRLCGINIPVVSILTRMASRPKDTGHFVLGPVTLGLGALIALLIFPYQAAVIAILALAFGDGFASLTGKFFGKLYPTFLLGKSIEGSLACFFAVFIIAYAFSGSVHISVLAAFTAMVVEAMPLGDYDNLAIPAAVGLVVNFSYFF